MSELEKLKDVAEVSQKIGEFLDWLLNGHGYYLCELRKCEDRDEFYPTHKHIEDILAQYFNIDLNKVEQEKRKILEEIRSKRNRKK